MSHRPPASTTRSHRAPYELPRSRRRFRRLGWSLALLLVLALSLLIPEVFRFAVRGFITLAAWRHGVGVHIHRVQGSAFEPITLHGSSWHYESPHGPVTRLEIKHATADFSWRSLWQRRAGARWFHQLTLTGVSGKTSLPSDPRRPIREPLFTWPAGEMGWAAPSHFEAGEIDFMVQSGRDFVRLQGGRLTASEFEPGTVHATQIAVKQAWLDKTFRNVSGTTYLRAGKLEIAQVTLEPGVQIESISTNLEELARGFFGLEMQLAGFGGAMRLQARTLSHDHDFVFEASGRVSNIALAQLATFLGLSEAAGGTIKQGNFNFRGSPRDLAHATATVRLEEVTNFQWESRQWDSLVLGATLMERRVRVPSFALRQGKNRLDLNGDFVLPIAGAKWWQGEFSANVAARIENLTELSALLLPEFKYTAGKVTIDGSIHGQSEKFTGQLLVGGSSLRWRDAPIEELSASVRLEGNEVKLTNFALFNDGDYVRGRGVVNILGTKQYWGELRASIGDLATYAALLQKPIIAEPLAGGAVLNWSGEGSPKGHSGMFGARLKKVRSLGASAALLHPVNAELDGTYAPGQMLFSRFAVSDDDTALTANVAVGNKALSLRAIRLMHGPQLWLEGDALLPLDVWKAWPNTSLATLLDDTTVSQVNLTAYHLSLRETAQLTGWNFPIEGFVTGFLAAEGLLGALKTRGSITLSEAKIPLGWSDVALTEVNTTATFSGQTLSLPQLTCRHPMGEFTIRGEVDFTDLRDPHLALTAGSAAATLAVYEELTPPPYDADYQPTTITAALDLSIKGPIRAAIVSGSARALGGRLGGRKIGIRDDGQEVPTEAVVRTGLDVSGLSRAALRSELPLPFQWRVAPWTTWSFDVACQLEEEAAQLPENHLQTLALQLTGTGAAPTFVGEVAWRDLTVVAGTLGLEMESARLVFRQDNPALPSLDLRATGRLHEEPFAIQVTGPITHPLRYFEYAPPLSEPMIRAALREGRPEEVLLEDSIAAPRFSLRAPAGLIGDVPDFAWNISEYRRELPEEITTADEEAPRP